MHPFRALVFAKRKHPHELKAENASGERDTHIDHALTLALMNSVTVRNGTLPTIITVELSSRRGPSSPAGRISICDPVGGVSFCGEAHRGGRKDRGTYSRRWEVSVAGISHASWSYFVNASCAAAGGAVAGIDLPIAPRGGHDGEVLVPCQSLAYATKRMNRPTFDYATYFLETQCGRQR